MGNKYLEKIKALEVTLNKQKVTIFALIVTLIGILFIFVPVFPKSEDLGLSLVPSGIITALVEFFLRSDFISDLKEIQRGQDLSEKLENLGIVDIYEERGAQQDPVFGYVATMAKDCPKKMKKVCIIGESIQPFKNLVGDSDMESLLRAGCKFKFLNLDANGEVARKRSNEQGQPGLLDSIRSFDSWIQQHTDRVNKDKSLKGSIETRKYNLMPTMHITMINDEKIFVNFYPILGLTWEFPVIEVRKGSVLFEKYKKQFEEVWAKAQPPDHSTVTSERET